MRNFNNLLHRTAAKLYDAEHRYFMSRHPSTTRAWVSFRRLIGKEKEFWFAHAQRFLAAFPGWKRPGPQRMDLPAVFDHRAYVAHAA